MIKRCYFFNGVLLAAVVLAFCFSSPAHANQEPQPIAGDPRIRTYVYDPNDVYIFTGHYKYSSIIEFDNDENIDSISLGDPTGWQIVHQGARLFMKPIDQNATTNMTIFTDKRIYFFELHAEQAEDIRDEEIVFLVQFVYPDSDKGEGATFREFDVKKDPENSGSSSSAKTPGSTTGAAGEDEEETRNYVLEADVPDTSIDPQKYNFNYAVTGSRLIAPLKVFDDGEFTYLEFRRINADIPAIYLVNEQGDESLVNFRSTGNYLVIEQVSQQYTLRHGADIACLFNETDPLKRLDLAEKNHKFLGIF